MRNNHVTIGKYQLNIGKYGSIQLNIGLAI